MEMYVGNVVINKSGCLLPFILLFMPLNLCDFMKPQPGGVGTLRFPSHLPRFRQVNPQLGNCLLSLYLSDCCKRCIPGHGKHCTGQLWGKERQPKTDPEPKCQVDHIRGAGGEDGLCSAPLGCFRLLRILLSPVKSQWSADTQRSWL